MGVIRRSRDTYGQWVFGAVALLAAEAAVAQEQQAAAQSESAAEVEKSTVTTTTTTSTSYNILTTQRLTGDWGGVRTDLENAGITFKPIFGSVYQFNFRGGQNTHHAHESGGTVFHNIELDFNKMFKLEGGTFFLRAIQSWNKGIGADVGSLKAPFYNVGSSGDQSIEIDKWWWRQRLFDDRLEFRLGLIKVTDTFDRNAYADNYFSKFCNRDYYMNMVIPSTGGLGMFVRVWPVDWLYVQGLVADLDRDKDRHRHGTSGFETAFHDDAHFRAFWEFGVLPAEIPGCESLLPGHYRFGSWFNPSSKTIFIDDLGGLRAEQHRGGDVGFYFNFDQMVWKENPTDVKDKQGLGVFARYGFAHPDVNKINHFWSAGAAYHGLVPSRDKDVLGFGVAQSILSKTYRHNVDSRADRETVYELYYAIHVTPWCVITPDVQVITNPGGSKDARDALVGGVRVKIAF